MNPKCSSCSAVFFRITDVCNRGTGQEWIIHMTLCDDSNHHLSQLVDHMEVENENFQPNLASFGLLLWKMGKYDLAEKYLRRRLSEISVNDPKLGSVYLHLGLVIAEKGDYLGSLWCYDKALTFLHANRYFELRHNRAFAQ